MTALSGRSIRQKFMKKFIPGLTLLAAVVLWSGCGSSSLPTSAVGAETTNNVARAAATNNNMSDKVIKSDEEWKKQLTPEQYRVLREKGTERAFTGQYWNTKDQGVYRCAGCGEELFVSYTKFDSGCGWPSFYAPFATNMITEAHDNTHFMQRTEVMCSKCGGHLGHVFDDGPKPTGLRYCINSASIAFEPKKDEKKESVPAAKKE